nr:hypothetical protein [bacterium]
MLYTEKTLDQVIPEGNIIVFAPHYDDFLFGIGGLALGWRKMGIQKNVTIRQLFTRSNYLAHSGAANFDPSTPRVQKATGIRLIEDLNCIDEILGRFQYTYELGGENECFTRDKKMSESGMEFPHGMYEDFDDTDRAILQRMIARVEAVAGREDTALVFPLAIREHIDHFIVREAGLAVARRGGNKAAFYFQEDKPYTGNADATEWQRITDWVASNPLEARVYPADAARVVELAFTHYVSQVDETYRQGVMDRGAALQAQYGADSTLDQLYRYNA